MPTISFVPSEPFLLAPNRLEHAARNVFSQFGEDGILVELFNRIGTTNCWSVEFGAWDGVKHSNSARLIQEDGWHSVQIEAHPSRYQALLATYGANSRVHTVNAMIGFRPGPGSLDTILAKTALPLAPDLMSIDIDGNDFHVWKSLKRYRPRVVIVEFNPTIPNDVIFVQDADPAIAEGCSAAALVRLGSQKGYSLAAVTVTNVIFVVSEDYPALGITDNRLPTMRRDPPNRIWCGYNGKIYHTLKRLHWTGRDVPLHPDSLQVLQDRDMYFGKPPKTAGPPAGSGEADGDQTGV